MSNVINGPPAVIAADRRAVSGFVEAARAVAPARWAMPRAPGKWSPSQVTEHVVLTYEQSRRMLEGTFVGHAKPWYMQLLARLSLPRLFKRGTFGEGPMRGPDFIQPGDAPPSSAVLLDRLELVARYLEQHLTSASDAKPTMVVHPIFGRLPLTDLLHFLWIHTEHHRPQLAAMDSAAV